MHAKQLECAVELTLVQEATAVSVQLPKRLPRPCLLGRNVTIRAAGTAASRPTGLPIPTCPAAIRTGAAAGRVRISARPATWRSPVRRRRARRRAVAAPPRRRAIAAAPIRRRATRRRRRTIATTPRRRAVTAATIRWPATRRAIPAARRGAAIPAVTGGGAP